MIIFFYIRLTVLLLVFLSVSQVLSGCSSHSSSESIKDTVWTDGEKLFIFTSKGEYEVRRSNEKLEYGEWKQEGSSFEAHSQSDRISTSTSGGIKTKRIESPDIYDTTFRFNGDTLEIIYWFSNKPLTKINDVSEYRRNGTFSNKGYFTKADFEELRWLEGTWRGMENHIDDEENNKEVFERCRFVGEDKIEIDSFSDSTFSKVIRQSSVYFENGEIIYKSGTMVWSAHYFVPGITFKPKENATYSFNWGLKSANVEWGQKPYDVWVVSQWGKDTQGNQTGMFAELMRVKK